MARGFKTFRIQPKWLPFIMLELIHVPVILFFSIGGHLTGFRWKGQKFQRRRSPEAPDALLAAGDFPIIRLLPLSKMALHRPLFVLESPQRAGNLSLLRQFEGDGSLRVSLLLLQRVESSGS